MCHVVSVLDVLSYEKKNVHIYIPICFVKYASCIFIIIVHGISSYCEVRLILFLS